MVKIKRLKFLLTLKLTIYIHVQAKKGTKESGVENRSTTVGESTLKSQISTGNHYSCYLNKKNGSVKCWGENTYGQLGLGDITGSKRTIGNEAGEMPYIATQQLYSKELKNEVIQSVIKDNIGETQIAKDLEIPRGTVSSWVYLYKKKHGLKIQARTYYPPELKDEAIEMVIEDGTSIEEVAKQLDIPKQRLLYWLDQQNKQKNSTKSSQENKPNLISTSQSKNSNAIPEPAIYRDMKKEDDDELTKIDPNTTYLEAIEEVLKNHNPRDVAKKFDIDEEILKLRVRQYQY